MKLKMLKELLDGDLKDIIKSMSKSDMEKKLKGLKGEDGPVKKVTVASDSEEGLMEGLEKAEELLEGKKEDEMMSDGEETSDLEEKALASMGKEDDSVTEDLPSVEEALNEKKKKKSALKGLI